MSVLHPLIWFTCSAYAAGAVAAAAIALACFNPGWAMYMSFPCLLAATVEGTLVGSLLPAPANRILHPIIITCLVINAGAAIFGAATGVGYHQVLQGYLTKVMLPEVVTEEQVSICALQCYGTRQSQQVLHCRRLA